MNLFKTTGKFSRPDLDRDILSEINTKSGTTSSAPITLDSIHNDFNKKVGDKTNNIFLSHEKARYNQSALTGLKNHIDKGDFLQAENYARKNNMNGLIPEIQNMKKNSIDQATLSMSLENLIDANKNRIPATENRKIGTIKTDIETQISRETDKTKINKLKARQQMILDMESKIDTAKTVHTNSYDKTIDVVKTYANSDTSKLTSKEVQDQKISIITDLETKLKAGDIDKQFLEDIMPEHNFDSPDAMLNLMNDQKNSQLFLERIYGIAKN
jgi:hypothetical protein